MLAGAPFGRSANPGKNKFQNLKAFHFNLGQNNLMNNKLNISKILFY